ncbi:sensor protein PhoQ [Methyloglobulus morosus KoM1]|uniref:histidine kinase n=1 Tax=Methyloglobulus morosus KoM1 TaxID=1116472 RepID=V5B9L0_9GAMM|nr:ATP-binding protein [Methyloglobulus morosus]ESS69965.1 sensor protein PhoQ [Methyloglobulus morosus KoM1]
MRTKSLSFRLLATEGLVLAAFLALVAVVLEQSFRESAEQALKERLQVQIYSLLSTAELKNSGDLSIPSNLPEPRFVNPGSGLYAFIQKTNKNLIWRSPSSIGLDVPTPPEKLGAGNTYFLADNPRRYFLHYDIIWKNLAGIEKEYIFTVAEDSEFVSQQVNRFRKALWSWLAVIGIVLIFLQFSLLRWCLKPIRIIVNDLNAIEKGKKTLLDGEYSTELQSLAGNLNAFITHERAHLERYRNTLADLAHSLKTPLAILRGCTESFSDNKETVQEQITIMDKIVEYQLQRAAAKGGHKAIKGIDLSAFLNKISSSLNKVYIDKAINTVISVPEQCQIYFEEGDLYEIIGNLLDNACKWCKHNTKITVTKNPRKDRRNYALLIQIDDDGPGIPDGKLNEILKRGVRADENIHGHGIGMTVVFDLVGMLGGKLEGNKSTELGGMSWRVYLP